MNNAHDHYESLLGPVYSWMVGDIAEALTRSAAEFDALPLPLPLPPGRVAFDLGAGIGLHAERGYSVTAIDSCQVLVDELRSRAGALPIKAIHAEILSFRAYVEQPLLVILRMGDTSLICQIFPASMLY